MFTIESLIGPQFCSLCDRNITQSIKIRSKEHDSAGSSGKPVIICLECHKSGVTIGSDLQKDKTSPSKSIDNKESKDKHSAKTIGDYAVLDNLQFQLFH